LFLDAHVTAADYLLIAYAYPLSASVKERSVLQQVRLLITHLYLTLYQPTMKLQGHSDKSTIGNVFIFIEHT
jgi:hypothetical protein